MNFTTSRFVSLRLTTSLAPVVFWFVLASANASQPNVVFIAIDDQNDWIGCLNGHPQVQTPHIDRLANRGTVFLNAHCQAPLCNSSRTSLMTGMRPSTTGIYGLAPWFRKVESLKDLETLPQFFRRHGYRTYSAGKIFHGGYGRKPGDNEFDVLGPPAGILCRPPKKIVDTPSKHPLVDWGTFPHEDEQKGDYRIASWAVNQLSQQQDQPFFLSCGFFLPHVPCYASQKWHDLYPDKTLILPPFLSGDREDIPRFSWYLHWKLPEPRKDFLDKAGEWKHLVRSYLACTSFIDSQVGRILDALRNDNLQDDTIVVLWSDHGWHLGEKRITGKNTLWDRSTRVPLIFSGPGITSGQACKRPAELLDMYPTLIDLCGLPEKPSLEGISLKPQLVDADTRRDRPAITTHNHDNHGVRSEKWRYIVYADGSQELYDMESDPNEWTNLAGDAQFASVIEAHRQWLPKNNAKPAPGSRHRILTRDANGKVVWQGEEISPDAPIPEIAP